MSRLTSGIVLVALVAMLSLFAAGCTSSRPDVTVTFVVDNIVNDEATLRLHDAYGELPTVTQTGYTFAGWWSAQVDGNLIDAQTVITNRENHSLYARWTPVSATISFDTNGADNVFPPESVSREFGLPYGELERIERDDYIFDGWWTGAQTGHEIEPLTLVETYLDHTLYARWISLTEGATPQYTLPDPFTGVLYGTTLSNLALPQGWAWLNAWQTVGEVGIRSFGARYVPADPGYHAIIDFIEVSVVAALPAPPQSFDNVEPGTLLGSLPLPAGWRWTDGDNRSTGDVGVHYFSATYTPSSANQLPHMVDVEITVALRIPGPYVFAFMWGSPLNSIILPPGWEWVDGNQLVQDSRRVTEFPARFISQDGNHDRTEYITVDITFLDCC